MEEVPKQEQLVKFMDANACTGRRVKGGWGARIT